MKHIYIKIATLILLITMLMTMASACVDTLPEQSELPSQTVDTPNDTQSVEPTENEDPQKIEPSVGGKDQENDKDNTENEDNTEIKEEEVITSEERPEILTADTEDLWQKGKDIWDALNLSEYEHFDSKYIEIFEYTNVIPLKTPSFKTAKIKFNWTYYLNQYVPVTIPDGDFVLTGESEHNKISYIIAATEGTYQSIYSTLWSQRENYTTDIEKAFNEGNTSDISTILFQNYIYPLSLTNAEFTSTKDISLNDIAIISLHSYVRNLSYLPVERDIVILKNNDYTLYVTSKEALTNYIQTAYPGAPVDVINADTSDLYSLSESTDWYVHKWNNFEYPGILKEEMIIEGKYIYITDYEITTLQDSYVTRKCKYTFKTDQQTISIVSREIISELIEERGMYPPTYPFAPEIKGYTYLGDNLYKSDTTNKIYGIPQYVPNDKALPPIEEIPVMNEDSVKQGTVWIGGSDSVINVEGSLEVVPTAYYDAFYYDGEGDVQYNVDYGWYYWPTVYSQSGKGSATLSLQDEYKDREALVTVYTFKSNIIGEEVYKATLTDDRTIEIPLTWEETGSPWSTAPKTLRYIFTVEFKDNGDVAMGHFESYFDDNLSLVIRVYDFYGSPSDAAMGVKYKNMETGEFVTRGYVQ